MLYFCPSELHHPIYSLMGVLVSKIIIPHLYQPHSYISILIHVMTNEHIQSTNLQPHSKKQNIGNVKKWKAKQEYISN